MLFRWLPTYRAARVGRSAGRARPKPSHFPVPIVVVHGLLAITTVVLALLTVISGK